MPSPLPSAANDYKVYGDTPISAPVLGAILTSIAERLNEAEAVRADFQALIDAGTGTALEAIQVNLSPKIAALDATIATMQTQFAVLQAAYNELTTGQLSASAVTVSAITGLTAREAQAAIAEMVGMIKDIQSTRGNSATKDVGVTADTVAAGDDARFTDPVADARLPGRLGMSCGVVDDWNAATANGWYMGAEALHGPPGFVGWALGEVIVHIPGSYCTQTVHSFLEASSANSMVMRRHQSAGVFGDWYTLQIAQYEQDLRYARLAVNNTFSSDQAITKFTPALILRDIAGGDVSLLSDGLNRFRVFQGNIETFSVTAAGGLWTKELGDLKTYVDSQKGLAKAWVNFGVSGTTPTIRASKNVSSITYISGGIYDVNFATPMMDANYVPAPFGSNAGTGMSLATPDMANSTTAKLRLLFQNQATNAYNPPTGGVAVFGN